MIKKEKMHFYKSIVIIELQKLEYKLMKKNKLYKQKNTYN
jgi:hypothetical protein